MSITTSSLPLNVNPFVSKCGCTGYGFEHKYWRINGFGSLRSKRFRGVWEQRKMRNGMFGLLPAQKMGREPKMSDRGGGGEERGSRQFPKAAQLRNSLLVLPGPCVDVVLAKLTLFVQT